MGKLFKCVKPHRNILIFCLIVDSMSKISERVIEKIKTDILYYLYQEGIKAKYTREIANELGRDKEFILKIIKELEKKNLVKNVLEHKVRRKWVMNDLVYKKYKEIY